MTTTKRELLVQHHDHALLDSEWEVTDVSDITEAYYNEYADTDTE